MSIIAGFFLRNMWPGLVLWDVLYVSDYVLTITCERLINGSTLPPLTPTGSYTINLDCTGSFTLKVFAEGDPKPITTSHANFVITDVGKAFRAVVTDQGSSVLVAKRQGPEE